MFASCGFSKIVLPESVKSIGYGAFYLSYLKSVVISSNVESIDREAFSACTKLSSVTIPDKLESISLSTFSG
ncbi:MAG: leucine-rich repeat protein [Bacteroides sp.]|nr:leucine-rich repeat protein [Bacteroides sp.]